MNNLTSDEKIKIQKNLEYINLNLDNIPEFIKNYKFMELDQQEDLMKIKVEYINI